MTWGCTAQQRGGALPRKTLSTFLASMSLPGAYAEAKGNNLRAEHHAVPRDSNDSHCASPPRSKAEVHDG